MEILVFDGILPTRYARLRGVTFSFTQKSVMRLVIDAGTTKTLSALLRNDSREVTLTTTSGINPVTDKDFSLKIHELCRPYRGKSIDALFYYGSGCINEKVNQEVIDAIGEYFPTASIHVEDDLLGAGIATCGFDKGITVIAGTGSNIGYFENASFVDGIKSCGYLIGDEGSGYQIGKEIYKRFCRGLLHENVLTRIETDRGVKRDEAIQSLYTEPNQRHYLASFSTYIKDLSREETERILKKVIGELLENMILPLSLKYNVPVHFVGSIGFHFAALIKEMLHKNDIIAGTFIKTPIEGLINFHRYE